MTARSVIAASKFVVPSITDGAIARVLSNPSDTEYVMVEQAWAPEPPKVPAPPPETPAAPKASTPE